MSLAKQCRYIGHVGEKITDFLSVAQHCTMMAEAVLLVTGNPKLALGTLLHDSWEGYTGDISTPLKKLVKEVIKPIEENGERIIFNHFGLEYPMNPIIKHVDVNFAKYELTFAVHNPDVNKYVFDFWTIEQSYNKFMAMFHNLQKMIEIEEEANENMGFKNSIIQQTEKIFLIDSDDMLSRILLMRYLGFAYSVDTDDSKYLCVDYVDKTMIPVKNAENIDKLNNFMQVIKKIGNEFPEEIENMKQFVGNLHHINTGAMGEIFGIDGSHHATQLELGELAELRQLSNSRM